MLQFMTKTKSCPYEIIGGRMIFSKNLDEPFENYHRTILNYPTLSVHFSFCKDQELTLTKDQELTLTKNISCIVIKTDSCISTLIFPKYMMYTSITIDLVYLIFHGFNKYMKRIYLEANIMSNLPLNLPKNMIFFSGFSFTDHDFILSPKLITYHHYGNCKPIILPKKLRYLTFQGTSCNLIYKTLLPPKLKFLHVELSHYLDKNKYYCRLTLTNPLTTFITMENYDHHKYIIDHIDAVERVYIDTQFKLPNVPCKSIVHYNPNVIMYNSTDNNFAPLLVIAIISGWMFLCIIGITAGTFRMSIFYHTTLEFLQHGTKIVFRQ